MPNPTVRKLAEALRLALSRAKRARGALVLACDDVADAHCDLDDGEEERWRDIADKASCFKLR